MFPLASTAGKNVVPLNGVTAVTGADQAAPARLRAIAMRPPGTPSSSQTATASPARPSAIVAPSAFTVAAEIGVGPCQAAAAAFATTIGEQRATDAIRTAMAARGRLMRGS